MRWGYAKAAAVAISFAIIPTAAQPQESKRWFVIETEDGKRIGHGDQTVSILPNGARVIFDETRSRTQEAKARAIRQRELTIRIQGPNGRLASITQTSWLGSAFTTISVSLTGDVATVERETGSDKRRTRLMLPADIRFDNGAALLGAWSREPGTSLRYSTLNLSVPQVEQVIIDQPADQSIGLADGTIRVRRQIFDQGQLRAVNWITLDRDGRIIRTESPMFGSMAITRQANQGEALAKHPPFSLVRNAMVKAPFRVPMAAMNGHIRYRFAFRDGVSFDPLTTGEQRGRVTGSALILDICKTCGEQATPLSDEERTRFLAATKWMQADHPTFRIIAKPIAQRSITDTEKMKLLSDKVAKRLKRIDFAGHVSALEAWQRGRWDCTEEAAILATLARAAGIPARVASGLVYSRAQYHGVSNVFMPHAWTLAYIDGRWQSFDVSIGQFDATHIAFATGDGDSRSMAAGSALAGLTQMEDMVEVRSRATAP